MALEFCQIANWGILTCLQMHLVNGNVQEYGIQCGTNETE